MAVTAAAIGLAGANFRDDCDIPWAPENAYFSPDGHSLTMSLPRENSGCALQTKKQFIYGSVSTLIKLIPGDSAGTVTTYYVRPLINHTACLTDHRVNLLFLSQPRACIMQGAKTDAYENKPSIFLPPVLICIEEVPS